MMLVAAKWRDFQNSNLSTAETSPAQVQDSEPEEDTRPRRVGRPRAKTKKVDEAFDFEDYDDDDRKRKKTKGGKVEIATKSSAKYVKKIFTLINY